MNMNNFNNFIEFKINMNMILPEKRENILILKLSKSFLLNYFEFETFSDIIVVFVSLKFDNKPIQHILRRHERKYNLKTTKE